MTAVRAGRVVWATLLGLAACSATPSIGEKWFETAAPPVVSAAATDFPGAAEILAGFDTPGKASDFARGDRALYGIELVRGDEVERWLMKFEITEPLLRDEKGDALLRMQQLTVKPKDEESRTRTVISRLAGMHVSRFEADGTQLGESDLRVPRDGLSRGIAAGCALWENEHAGKDGPGDPIETTCETLASMLDLFRLVQDDELLSSVLWKVVRAPSLWSVVTSMGVTVSVEFHLDASKVVATPSPLGGIVHRFPMTIYANDEPALLLFADVTDPASPLNVGGGTLALTGTLPGDDSVHFSMRLLAARRGPR